ncbi:hypothetical protein [Rhodovulum strictum]|uniref:VPLPA-CTERM protein sorting domain-containing protein n=1 Tax=Rhodovulum strictum TaxID=58314 RepID=A0A844B687_9RHOB|nr:hypothetical protein [Rhodovulum strictum]MRH21741.1 hypothetical protein [Rhodovulum strictum]
MRNLLASLALSLAAAFPALSAGAAPVIDLPYGEAAFTAFGGAGDLTLFGADALVNGPGLSAGLTVDLALFFDQADPYRTLGGFLDLYQGAELFLGGLLTSVSAEEDLLTLVFGMLIGSGAALFGDALRVELFFIDPVGADPLAGLQDGAVYAVAALGEGQLAPVPLPAGLPLLLAGLGAMLALRRGARA